jgi:hypothetical protein
MSSTIKCGCSSTAFGPSMCSHPDTQVLNPLRYSIYAEIRRKDICSCLPR